MVALTILGISLILSLISLPFWMIEKERERERHARALELAREENARYQADVAYRASMMQNASDRQRAMNPGGEADAIARAIDERQRRS